MARSLLQPEVEKRLDGAAAAGAARMKLAVQRSLAARHQATAQRLEAAGNDRHKEDRRLRLAFSQAAKDKLGMPLALICQEAKCDMSLHMQPCFWQACLWYVVGHQGRRASVGVADIDILLWLAQAGAEQLLLHMQFVYLWQVANLAWSLTCPCNAACCRPDMHSRQDEESRGQGSAGGGGCSAGQGMAQHPAFPHA